MTQSRLIRWWPAFLIPVLVGIAYWPVIAHGGFIWDDPQHVTLNTTLRDWPGLVNIWIHPLSIPQYYPLVHTTFWIEYHLWRLQPMGYHIDNILLHTLAAILLWRVLIRLNIPAAWLAAAIFAVHPVQVESVAWITERKNVLSAVLYLASLHAYLNFAGDDFAKTPRNRAMYFTSLGLFVAALLSKSVACSLPAAILLLIWWKRGKITRRDINPTIPFFIIGLAMSWVTGYLEQTHVGAAGDAWNFTIEERCLIASRAIWFYVGKILWPHPLAFIYPKWEAMNLSSRPWLIAFPITATAALAALWMLRRRIGRGPLVAALFFVGTLVPALGFVNLFPMQFTFVADHYQYIACIGLIVPISVILYRWAKCAAAIVLIPLVALSWRQGRNYQDALTLWLDAREKNPNSWMIWGDLADEYAARGDHADAKICYARLLQLAPEKAIAHWKWGLVLEFDNDLPGAEAEFNNAIALEPHASMPRESLGILLLREGRISEALEYFRTAVALNPGAVAHFNYGVALEKTGDIVGALSEYDAAIAADPHLADAQFNLANLLMTHEQRPDLAIPHFEAALADRPERFDYHFNYASALRAVGRVPEARDQCRIVLQLNPGFAPAKQFLSATGGM